MNIRKIKQFVVSLILVCVLMPSLTVLATNPTPIGQTPSGIPFSELESQIDFLVEEHLGVTIPGVAIVVVHDGEIIFSRGYGYANIANQTPINPATTLFEYASISKPFVWVAAMQLVEQGLMRLDGDITNYLPPSFVFEKPITMRNLMNHTAGFAEVVLGITVHTSPIPTLEETLLATQPRQIFTPDEVAAYSNWGSSLAAMAVEYVSGQEFATQEREAILLPLGMENTLNFPYWFGNTGFLANRAQGYSGGGEGGFSEQGMAVRVTAYPSGSIHGTAEDLARFIKALTPPAGEPGPLFENAETVQALFSPSSPDYVNRPTPHHGFLTFSGIYPAFGHGGNRPGFTGSMVIVPELRFGYAILTNVTGEMDLIPSLNHMFLGDAPMPTVGNSLPNAQAVAGHFIPARRTDSHFMELMIAMQIINVTVLDENTIQLSAMGMYAIYKQIEPYVFAVYDATGAPFMAQAYPLLRFRMEDGVAVQIIDGRGFDLTSLPAGRTMPFLITHLVIAAVCMVFFLIAPIVLLVVFIARRRKRPATTHFDRFRLGFLLSGTALTLNFLAMPLRMAISYNRTLAEMSLHIWLNWIFAGVIVLALAGCIWQWRFKEGGKVLFITTVALLSMFIFLLQNWNFFVFI